jgi:hypothetical protein
MEQFYQLCAILGGTIFLGQFVLSLVGLTGDHELAGDSGGDHFDGGADHADGGGHEAAGGDSHHGVSAGHESANSWFVRILSVRTVIAGLTFFGLGGLAANASGANPLGSLTVAAVCGFAALYIVGWAMRTLMRLRSDGTVHIENAVGQPAVVYLTIPGHRAGKGKVTVTVQNRTMEYEAETDCATLPTGAMVQVVAISSAETVEVVPAPEPAPAAEPARTSHA